MAITAPPLTQDRVAGKSVIAVLTWMRYSAIGFKAEGRGQRAEGTRHKAEGIRQRQKWGVFHSTANRYKSRKVAIASAKTTNTFVLKMFQVKLPLLILTSRLVG